MARDESIFKPGELLTLAEAARHLRPDKPPHPSTVHRWRTRGVRGVRLPTMLVGGQRFVRVADLDRFLWQINYGGDARRPTAEPPSRAAEDAGAELAAAGC